MLSLPQQRQLRDQGFIHLPGLVPQALVDQALRAINADLDGSGVPPDQLGTYRAQSWCPAVRGTPAISSLVERSPVRPLFDELFGADRIAPIDGGQIALRFPSLAVQPRQPTAHIDGMYTPTNGVPPEMVNNFAALACVLLSEVAGPWCGNFTVWPGSHRLHHEWMRAHGTASLLKGMPKVAIGESRQLTGAPGDVVIAHYLLGHSAAANLSPHIRYAIFFRLDTLRGSCHRWEAMADPWEDWHGLAEATAERPAA